MPAKRVRAWRLRSETADTAGSIAQDVRETRSRSPCSATAPSIPSLPWLRADDEAVLRGRAAFETLRVYAGRPFRLAEHLERLARSADVLELDAPDAAGLEGLVGDALAGLGDVDAVLRLVWTPGAGRRRRHRFRARHAAAGGARRDPGARDRAGERSSSPSARRPRQSSPWLLAGRQVDELCREHGRPARGPQARRRRRALPVARRDRARVPHLEHLVRRGRRAAHARPRPGHPGRRDPRHPARGGRRGADGRRGRRLSA